MVLHSVTTPVMNKDPSGKSWVKCLLMVLSASMLVCGRLAAQTNNGKTAADLTSSPSGTRFPDAAIGSVNIDQMMIGAQLCAG